MYPIMQLDAARNLLEMFSQDIKWKHIPMTGKYVVDSIGDDYKSWDSQSPIFIDSPTGSRKSTFVFTQLLSYAIENNRTMLILSNRIALSAQQKRSILLVMKEHYPEISSDFLEDSSKTKIDELSFLGPVCIATYQGLYKLRNSPDENGVYPIDWFSRLLYVVCDECHFLYSDALFNSSCGHILKKLPVVFQNAIRVYITATAWEIRDAIFDSEKRYLQFSQQIQLTNIESAIARSIPTTQDRIKAHRTFFYYHMPSDYSAYRLHFFNDTQYQPPTGKKDPLAAITRKKYLLSLVQQMKPIPSHDNKWLIFVDKKNSGQSLMEILKKLGVSVAYIDSKSKLPMKAWRSLIDNSFFNESALIASPVIECGVNIHDPAVKNITILCTERTTFIQLLGRKRLQPGETVDVWVWLPDPDYFIGITEKIEWYLKLAKRLRCGKYGNPSMYADAARTLWEKRKDLEYDALFYMDHNGQFAVNEYAEAVLTRRYNFLLQFTDSTDPETIRSTVEEWLGIPGEIADLSLPLSADDSNPTLPSQSAITLSALLEPNADVEIEDGAFAPIRKAIVDQAIKAGVKGIRSDRKDTTSALKLTKILCTLGIPYKIKKSKKKWSIHPITS